MELTESMFRHLAQTVCGTTKITYNGKRLTSESHSEDLL